MSGARDKASPGSVICLLPGTYKISSTFSITKSGTRTSPITYRAYSTAPILQWTGPSGSADVLWIGNGNHDVVFDGLIIDGANGAGIGVKCSAGSYGITVRRSTVRYTSSAGVQAKGCDYMTVEGNFIYHTGYDPNVAWSSAVSLQKSVWRDGGAGFHSYVADNVIAGATDESSAHTEGHGVIMDRGGNVPPVLIANNLIYENGGRGVELFHAQNIWVVNNTCYKNALDLRQGSGTNVAEFTANGSDASNLHFVNNVASAWTGRAPFQVINGASAAFDHNVEYGEAKSVVAGSVSASTLQLLRSDPLFQNPPALDATSGRQQGTALAPWLVGSSFVPQAGSPLLGRGIDPSNAAGMTSDLRTGVDRYLRTDLNGSPRPRGGGWDVGAYEQ